MPNHNFKISAAGISPEKDQSGQLLLEILIVIGLVATVSAIASPLILAGLNSNRWATGSGLAAGLAEETITAVEASSFERWQNIYGLNKSGSHYYPYQQAGAWKIAGGDETLTLNNFKFFRYFTVSDVCRDNTTRAIAADAPPCDAGNADDPSTQAITAYVGWLNGATTSRAHYLTRWRNRVCAQTGWSGAGSGTTTCPSSQYGSATDIDIAGTPGSLKLQAN